MTPQQLLQDYIVADKKRNNGSWGPQWEIHNHLNDLGYFIDDSNGPLRLEKRKGYWGNGMRWDGERIVGEWE